MARDVDSDPVHLKEAPRSKSSPQNDAPGRKHRRHVEHKEDTEDTFAVSQCATTSLPTTTRKRRTLRILRVVQAPQVVPLKGYWQDVVPTLQYGIFDGILHDTYPLSEFEWHTYQFDFIGELLKDTYDNIETMFKETQMFHVKKAGFKKENISWGVISNRPPRHSKKYQFPLMIAPKCI
ncbi:hypothetical protein Bbelb_054160 [Branchiostoma belcheri]|nr:hypothetical protein Bbelb_054160 [Branchiostoma belcheri]